MVITNCARLTFYETVFFFGFVRNVTEMLQNKKRSRTAFSCPSECHKALANKPAIL